MECIKIIESLIEKASKDDDLKKRLIEDSDKAIYQETGKLLAVEVKFLQDENGKLTYEIVSKAKSIPDEDLEGVSGGRHIHHHPKHPDHPYKKKQELIRDYSLGEEIDEDDLSGIAGGQSVIYPDGRPNIPVLAYAAPSYRTPEELKEILERLRGSGNGNN